MAESGRYVLNFGMSDLGSTLNFDLDDTAAPLELEGNVNCGSLVLGSILRGNSGDERCSSGVSSSPVFSAPVRDWTQTECWLSSDVCLGKVVLDDGCELA